MMIHTRGDTTPPVCYDTTRRAEQGQQEPADRQTSSLESRLSPSKIGQMEI
jgi:hypothetical protein